MPGLLAEVVCESLVGELIPLFRKHQLTDALTMMDAATPYEWFFSAVLVGGCLLYRIKLEVPILLLISN